jgi:hypothetical protein
MMKGFNVILLNGKYLIYVPSFNQITNYEK